MRQKSEFEKMQIAMENRRREDEEGRKIREKYDRLAFYDNLLPVAFLLTPIIAGAIYVVLKFGFGLNV
jgi:hypothetical protein